MLLMRKIILEESLVTISAIKKVGIPDSENGRSQKGKPALRDLCGGTEGGF